MTMFRMIRDIAHNLSRAPVTRRYPVKKREFYPGSRGRLEVDPDACVYCTLCQKRCPAGAITVVRKPKTLTLDPYRCILCGYCVEVCPEKCLIMRPEHRMVPDRPVGETISSETVGGDNPGVFEGSG